MARDRGGPGKVCGQTDRGSLGEGTSGGRCRPSRGEPYVRATLFSMARPTTRALSMPQGPATMTVSPTCLPRLCRVIDPRATSLGLRGLRPSTTAGGTEPLRGSIAITGSSCPSTTVHGHLSRRRPGNLGVADQPLGRRLGCRRRLEAAHGDVPGDAVCRWGGDEVGQAGPKAGRGGHGADRGYRPDEGGPHRHRGPPSSRLQGQPHPKRAVIGRHRKRCQPAGTVAVTGQVMTPRGRRGCGPPARRACRAPRDQGNDDQTADSQDRPVNCDPGELARRGGPPRSG